MEERPVEERPREAGWTESRRARRWDRRERRPRGLFFPLLLVSLGIILLLNSLGVLDVSLLSLARLWPVLLILIGLDILIGGRSAVGNLLLGVVLIAVLVGAVMFTTSRSQSSVGGGAATTEEADWALGEAEALDVTVDFGAGRLDLEALPASSDRAAEVSLRPLGGAGLEADYNMDGRQAELSVSQSEPDDPFGWWGNWDESRMSVALSRGVPVALDTQMGAGEVSLDLTGLEIEELNIELGAGELTVTLPEEGEFEADLSVGAGELKVIVPEGLEARIERDMAIGGMEFDESRFVQTEEGYVTRGFEDADERVVLTLDVAVGEINVR